MPGSSRTLRTANTRRRPPHPLLPRWLLVASVVLLAVVTVVSRLLPLATSLWIDEAYTTFFYVVDGPARIFDPERYLPNNHVLFSVLAWATARVLPLEPEVVRLWGVVPAIASVGVLGWWGTRRLGARVGLSAALLLATSQLHLDLSVQARGYGLGFLGVAGMLAAADAVEQAPAGRRLLPFAGLLLSGLVATLTLPQTVLLFAAHLLVLLRRRDLWAPTVAVGVLGAAVTVAVYQQVILLFAGQATRTGTREGVVVGLGNVLTGPAEVLLDPWVGGVLPGVLAGVVLGLAVVGAAGRLLRAGEDALLAHVLVPSGALLGFMLVVGTALLDRYVSFLLVPVAVVLAMGLAELVRLLGPRARPGAAVVGIVAAVALLGATLVGGLTRTRSYEAYQEALEVAHGSGVEPVLTNREPGTYGFVGLDPDVELVDDVAAACAREDGFVLLDYPWAVRDAARELVWEPETLAEDRSCLRECGRRVRVEQRRWPGFIDVWVVEPR